MASQLEVTLLEIVSPLHEDRSNLTAGRFNSTIPLVTGWFTGYPILVERPVGGCSDFFNSERCLFATVIHINDMAQLTEFGTPK